MDSKRLTFYKNVPSQRLSFYVRCFKGKVILRRHHFKCSMGHQICLPRKTLKHFIAGGIRVFFRKRPGLAGRYAQSVSRNRNGDSKLCDSLRNSAATYLPTTCNLPLSARPPGLPACLPTCSAKQFLVQISPTQIRFRKASGVTYI
jgi:hypothetical protein